MSLAKGSKRLYKDASCWLSVMVRRVRPWKASSKQITAGTLGVDAGDLDGVFDGLGAGVHQDGFFREVAGSEGVEFFGDGNVALIGSDGEAKMEVLLELFRGGGEDAGRVVADVEAADTTGEIEIAIAVDVFDGGAVGARGENWRGVRRAAGNGGFRGAPSRRESWARVFSVRI